MTEEIKKDSVVPEPRGLGEHTRGLAGEYAHEQGWGLNEAERTAVPDERQSTYGGREYDYGARDFGDESIDMTSASSGSADELAMDVVRTLAESAGGRNSVVQREDKAETSNQKDKE